MERAICRECGHLQPPGWSARELCILCGGTLELVEVDSQLQRIARWMSRAHDALGGIFLAVFGGLAGMLIAAWLQAGIRWIFGAGVVGLLLGGLLAWRAFSPDSYPPPVRSSWPNPAGWRYPGVQEEFARVRARQILYGALLITTWLAVVALSIASEQKWPRPMRVPWAAIFSLEMAVLVILAVLGWRNWRCPGCHGRLGSRISIRQCPNCGIVLREEGSHG